MDNQHIVNTTIGILGTIITYLLGGWDVCLVILAIFIGLDYMTGVIDAYMNRLVNSRTGFRGLLRKAEIFIVLVVATLLDRLINQGTWIFRTLVCYYYIANEGISILENVGKCGVPLPTKLFDALEQLKGGKPNEKDSRHK